MAKVTLTIESTTTDIGETLARGLRRLGSGVNSNPMVFIEQARMHIPPHAREKFEEFIASLLSPPPDETPPEPPA